MSRTYSVLTPRSAARRRSFRPRCEALEDRLLLAIYLVTNTDDFGFGSLRQAILDANAGSFLDHIHFNIPDGGVHTIFPLSALPRLTYPTVIDGYTQPGASPNTQAIGNNAVLRIQLSGSGAGSAAGLEVGYQAGGSTIRGLVINQFQQDGIRLAGTGHNRIAGNFIGTTATGQFASGNGGAGVKLVFADTFGGVSNTIGGPSPADRNVISGNGSSGIAFDDYLPPSYSNTIQGNYIGTNAAGTVAVPNQRHGLDVPSSYNLIGGRRGTFQGLPFNEGNLISGNRLAGVRIRGPGTESNELFSNYIGINAGGTATLPNGQEGVRIEYSENNVIGRPSDPSYAYTYRNVISGNSTYGVAFWGAVTNNVQDNYIGTAANGTSDLGNTRAGVFIGGGTSDNRVMSSNVIAFNGGRDVPNSAGVLVESGIGNFVQGNSIHSNTGLGIDLGTVGVTPNDPDNTDNDTGANNLQNFPVNLLATINGGQLVVTGTLRSTPSTTFRIDFYGNTSCDSSGHGEGQTHLAIDNAWVNAGGSGTILWGSSSVPIPAYVSVTATNTNTFDTSEFSACVPVTSGSAPGGGGGGDVAMLLDEPAELFAPRAVSGAEAEQARAAVVADLPVVALTAEPLEDVGPAPLRQADARAPLFRALLDDLFAV